MAVIITPNLIYIKIVIFVGVEYYSIIVTRPERGDLYLVVTVARPSQR